MSGAVTRRATRWAAGGLAVAVLAAGCGTVTAASSSATTTPPPVELSAAVNALGSSDALTLTAQLSGTPSPTTRGAAERRHTPAAARRVQFLRSSAIRLELRSATGKALTAAGATGAVGSLLVDATLLHAGTPEVELRSVGTTIYLRLDAAGLAALTGRPAAPLGARLAQLPPALAAGTRTLLAGGWVAVPLAPLLPFLPTVAPASGPARGPAAVRQQLLHLLASAVSVRRVSSSPSGDVLVATANTRTLATGLLAALHQALPAGFLGARLPSASSVPSRPLEIMAVVRSGQLRQVSIDLSQLRPGAAATAHPLLLVVTVSPTTPPIAAPAAFTTVDVTNLLTSLLRHAGGMSSLPLS